MEIDFVYRMWSKVENRYVVQVVKKGKYIQTPLLNSVCYFAKIIGNIHENPELLGGEK